MKHKLITILLFCFVLTIPSIAAGKNSSSANPLLGKFNEVIQFADLTADQIKEATNASINEARESLAKLYTIPKEQRTSITQCSNLITSTTNPATFTAPFI